VSRGDVAAFVADTGEHFAVTGTRGLTIREHFAAMAMQGLLAAGEDSGYPTERNVRKAIEYADALIAELAKARGEAS
jgi:hypothetical protein